VQVIMGLSMNCIGSLNMRQIVYCTPFIKADLSWNYPVSVGTRDMHKAVQNSHQNIINSINCDCDGDVNTQK
jgi:hypothetical protein